MIFEAVANNVPSQVQNQNSCDSDLDNKSKEFSSPGLIMNSAFKFSGKMFSGGETEQNLYGVEMDQDSCGSSEETESPIPVARIRKWKSYGKSVNINVCCLHIQVLRVREEDSHIGEDSDHHHTDYYLLFSRPVLPASPLGSHKTAINTVH